MTARERFILVASTCAATIARFEWPKQRTHRAGRARALLLPWAAVPPELFAVPETKRKPLTAEREAAKLPVDTFEGPRRVVPGTNIYSAFMTSRTNVGGRTIQRSHGIPGTITACVSSGHYLWHNHVLRSIAGEEALAFHSWSADSIARIVSALKTNPFFYKHENAHSKFRPSLRLVEWVGDSVDVILLRDVIRNLTDAHAAALAEGPREL